jgi:hypothetical protein
MEQWQTPISTESGTAELFLKPKTLFHGRPLQL